MSKNKKNKKKNQVAKPQAASQVQEEKSPKMLEYELAVVQKNELQNLYNNEPNFIQKNAILLKIQKVNQTINTLEGELQLKQGFLTQS